MQIEVSPHGQRIVDIGADHDELTIVDFYDKVLGDVVQIDVDGVNMTSEYVLRDVRLLRVNGHGRPYGVRVVLAKRGGEFDDQRAAPRG